jgi:hypothetical protein
VTDAGAWGVDFFEADGTTVEFTDVLIAGTGFDGIDFGDADGLTATFDDLTFAGTIGSSAAEAPHFLITSSETPAPSLDGNIINDTDNIPQNAADLCEGDFTGTVLFEDGAPVTVVDGVGCAP